MATNFPASLDNSTSLPYPSSGDDRNSPSLASGQSNQNDAVIAVETKLGTGASTPSGSNLLVSTGTGTSAWSKTAPTGTIVGTSDSQTLTNKILTSPTIDTPIINNPTLKTDSLAGYTSANNGTVYGISVSSSKISGTVLSDTTLPYTALDNGLSWVWSAFTPSPTGYSGTPTINIARYKQIGKNVFIHVSFTGTSNATTCTFTLPVAAKSDNTFGGGHITVEDSGIVQTSSGLVVLGAASTTATCYKTLARGAFTNSGTKAISVMSFVYEAN